MMGYTLIIGEAEFQDYSHDKVAVMKVGARGETSDDAPTFPNDEMTGNGNARSPSYSGWLYFCREVGIEFLFFGNDRQRRYYEAEVDGMHRESPIINEHPGFALINRHDVAYVKAALDDYKARYPNTSPGFDDWGTPEGEGVTAQDAAMARLLWLHFWMDWAVRNCEHPIIENY